MNKTDAYDYLFKLTLIGDSGVGKTNILSRYTHNEFNLESKSTIGVEFATKDEQIDNNIARIQVWDTAGQERYRAITSAYYRGAVGVIIVFDITKYNTFEHIPEWLNQVKNHVDSNTVIAIVGNKVDLEHLRSVESALPKKMAELDGLLFFEVSALDGSGIAQMFKTVAQQIHTNITKNIPIFPDPGPNSNPNPNPNVRPIPKLKKGGLSGLEQTDNPTTSKCC
jgi:Ras-related protein Rab-11A